MNTTHEKPTPATFTAVWPVLDQTPDPDRLITEAKADLPAVAARHRAHLTGKPHFAFRLGRNVPGSQGAKYVVTAEAPAIECAPRPYQDDAA